STGTPAGRVILFGTIPTTIPDTTPLIVSPTADTPIITSTIPPSPDHTPTSPDDSPASEAESDPSEDPTSGHIPPLPATSPFLSSDDDTTVRDTPDTLPSPTHDTPFTEITASTQRSHVIPRRRVMILSRGQPIPHGRPYRCHLNGPIHMMTARKRLRPLPVQQLSVRHPVDHSSSDSSLRHSPSDHSSPDLPSTSAGPSRKRRRSPMTSVPALPLISGALSPIRADLIPPPKRVRDIGYLADVEDDPRETRVERVVHPAMPKDISEPAQEGVAEVTYETLGDLVQRFHDHSHIPPLLAISPFLSSDDDTTESDTHDTPPSPTHDTPFTEITASTQRSPVIPRRRVMILSPGQPIPHGRPYRYHLNGPVHMMTARKRVRPLPMQQLSDDPRETRVERVVHPAMLEDIPEPALEGATEVTKMPNTRSRVSMTHEEVKELIARRVAEEMEAREVARNLEALNENEEEQEGENGGNENGGNARNGNGDNGGNGNEDNGNHGMNYG
nr:hypothetical protein [Tanacetum cinerariifolium]